MEKMLQVIVANCPQDHKCPSVGICPVGALSQKDFNAPEVDHEVCIRCGKCVEHCPMGLMPFQLNACAIKGDGEGFVAHHGLDCIECGSCSYVCPAHRELAMYNKLGKRLLREAK